MRIICSAQLINMISPNAENEAAKSLLDLVRRQHSNAAHSSTESVANQDNNSNTNAGRRKKIIPPPHHNAAIDENEECGNETIPPKSEGIGTGNTMFPRQQEKIDSVAETEFCGD